MRVTKPPGCRLATAVLLLLAACAALAAAPATSHAQACSTPVTNEVACENSKPGTPWSDWEVVREGDDRLRGFATEMSVQAGDTIDFKIKAASTSYHIDILRLGYYGGLGARKIASNLAPTGTSTQPACLQQASTGLIDCGNWAVSRSWTVPADAVSGVYIAHLVNNADPDIESHIIFVVRDDDSDADIVLQTSDQTWQAYNRYGGNSLYACTTVCPPGEPLGYKAAFKVSYNRPLTVEADSPPSALFQGAEYSMIRFLEANGYDMSYVSGVDTHARGQVLQNHRLFISSGHDEYWSAGQRSNVENARDAGVNLAFFAGNLMFWKTRFEPSIDGANRPNRTLTSYKDTHFSTQQDPVSWTGTWRDSRFSNPADNVTPENALTGTSFLVNSGTSRITVPYAYRNIRLWRNTDAANLGVGQTLNLAPDTLGYEWDVDADNGFRPAGTFKLSSTTATGLEVFTDYGSSVKLGGTATHNLTLYRAPSGARVFSAGTVQWAWGLDDNFHPSATPDRNMRQATVNLFADMGAQPYALMPGAGLVAASPSTDTAKPTSTINAPPASVQDGNQLTISGTASDAGGGVVGGVEVSTDGGESWHPATGTTNWSYTWIAHGHPSTTIRSRATDDSGNIETPTSSATINVACPCSLWGPNTSVPADKADSGDPTPVEVGVKFRSDSYGTVSGMRFYKAAANTGTHVGSLWTAGGQRLAQATFTGETASGWQTVTFSSPVEVQPNTTYVASYHAPNGHYSATAEYFYRTPAPGPNGGADIDSAPLHGVRNAGGETNGLFSYSAASTFPVNSYAASNYWVDVIYTPTAVPGAVTNVSATAGGRTSANVSWSAPASGGTVTSYRITPYVGSQAQTPKTVGGSVTSTTITGLTTGTTYTFRVEALNPNGSGGLSAPSGAVTPLGPVPPASPTDVSAQGASQSARVSWTAPSADGDSPITGYTVTPYVGTQSLSPVQAGASASSATVDGLTNGTAYTFRVTASNEVGSSLQSAPSAPMAPQATIFDFATPTLEDAGDPNPVELGVKFTPDYNGSVTGVRFYKASGNTGTHIGSLWAADGTRLAQATFTGESGSGWQSVTFSSPVPVTAGTTYVASYFAPNGHYSMTQFGFSAAVYNHPLRALGEATSPNGVYAYGATSRFPNASYRSSNYWVDVLYAVPAPGQVTGVSASESGPTSAILSWSPPASGGPVTSYRITPYVGSTAQAPTVVTGTPPVTSRKMTGLTTGTTYRFTVQALNANGSGAVSAQSNAVTPQAPVAPTAPSGVDARPASKSALVSWDPPSSDGDSPITGYVVTPYDGQTAETPVQVGASATSKVVTGLKNGTAYRFTVAAVNAVGTSPASSLSGPATPQATIFDFATPTTIDGGDSFPVTLGVRFQTDFAGAATGIRFYKATTNTGTHVGTLWSATGAPLAQATFTGERASGWQHVTFSNPVTLTPGTTYVASYHAPKGNYSITGGAFANPVVNAPLRALANGSGGNGVYAYGATTTFPTNSFNASNYGVDVLFDPAPAPGQVTNVSATAGQDSATVSWTAPSNGGPVTEYEITPYVGSTAQPRVTVVGSATSKTVTGLTAGTTYTFTVRATNLSGAGPESSASNPVTPLAPALPGAPTGATAVADSKSAIVGWTAPASDGGSPIVSYTVTPYVGSDAQTPTTVGGSTTKTRITGLTNGTSYTFRVKAANSAGSGPASDPSEAVSPKNSIFDLATPTTVDAGDPGSVVLGVKFQASVAGSVTGVRFYKASANTGTHVGSLWAADGTLLGEANFTGETASGWQTATFATPVPVTAGTLYVASYLAPNGHYSATPAAFASNPVVNPPLSAFANGTALNGVYRYSATAAFPSSSWNSTNYWVDVLFAPAS